MFRLQNQKSQEVLAMVLISLSKPKTKEKTKETKKKEEHKHKQTNKEKPNKERGKKQEKQNWKSSRAWSYEDKVNFEMLLRSLRWESFAIIHFTIYVFKNETYA